MGEHPDRFCLRMLLSPDGDLTLFAYQHSAVHPSSLRLQLSEFRHRIYQPGNQILSGKIAVKNLCSLIPGCLIGNIPFQNDRTDPDPGWSFPLPAAADDDLF